MTNDGPQQRNRFPRRAKSTSPDEKRDSSPDLADATAPTPAQGAGDQSPAQPRPRHRSLIGALSRSRAAKIASAIFAVVLVGGGVVVGLQLTGVGHPFSSPTKAQPTGSSPPAAGSGNTAVPPAPPGCGDPGSLLASMPRRDKLAQLLMVGVTDAADARAVVANQHVGGIFIASWTDLTMLSDGSLTDIANSAGPLHLAVSVDEEGGRVQRLTSLTKALPAARVLAQSESPEQVYQLALDHGRKLRQLGITIDFAPVVDVTDAPAGTVIGDRSFSPNPVVVTQYAGAFANGLRDAGVLPVLKHFPGHGRASGDSHATGVVTPPLSELQTLDLVPYRTLAAQLPVGVMVGHMQVPDLNDNDPASLSPAVVTLLRNGKDYGGPQFNGPVFTDDLSSMKAITDRYGIGEAALKALQAGADTALWVSTTAVPAVLDHLESAVATGELSMPNIEASVRRMAAAKAFGAGCGHR